MEETHPHIGKDSGLESIGQIGRGLVTYLKAKKIGVSRDMRVSSPELAAAFIDGARQQGADVVDYGMLPTDVMYHAVVTDNLEGGAQITASHNPGAYNGIKMVRSGALPLSGDAGIGDIRDMILNDRLPPPAAQPGGISSRNVLPGYPYFYVVTAYSETMEEVQGELQPIELHTLPASSEEAAVFPTSSAAAGTDKISVVPNPYLGGAGWDLKPNPTDPTGTKIAFNNLPPESTVRIFTLAGDLVETLLPAEQDGGTSYWDLISRNGQDIVSGLYLYSVESSAGSKIGKLVIVR